MPIRDSNYDGVGGVRTTHGSYVVHSFLDSGIFITGRTITGCYALVVGGGGSGGYTTAGWVGGGGGAGGAWVLSNFTIPIGTHPIIVGAGGRRMDNGTWNTTTRQNGGDAANMRSAPFNDVDVWSVTMHRTLNRNLGFMGEPSIAFGAIADGGGAGAGYNGSYNGGAAGGCGGGSEGYSMSDTAGGNSYPGAPSSMTHKQWAGYNGTGTGVAYGTAGGTGNTSNHNAGGGGGCGGQGDRDGVPHGGTGIENTLRTGASGSTAGIHHFGGGGGGGGTTLAGTTTHGGGAGGSTGGGSGTNAIANSGGGGGGRGRYNAGGTGNFSGAGGSGIVVLRIPA